MPKLINEANVVYEMLNVSYNVSSQSNFFLLYDYRENSDCGECHRVEPMHIESISSDSQNIKILVLDMTFIDMQRYGLIINNNAFRDNGNLPIVVTNGTVFVPVYCRHGYIATSNNIQTKRTYIIEYNSNLVRFTIS